MRKKQIILDYFTQGGEVHPRLPWIMRTFPDTVIVTDREHSPFYAENSGERYISADAWGMTVAELETFMKQEGPDYSYSSPASFAMSLWRTYFHPSKDYILRADGYRHKMCRDALYGGRCEVYQYGPGDYYQYDINSSYPAASTRLTFPAPSGVRYNDAPSANFIDTHDGVSSVVFSQEGLVPPLPVHAWGRVIYPVADHLTGTYTHTELRYAMGAGAVIHSVRKQYLCHTMLDDNPFTDFMHYCYNRRGEHKVWKRIANVLFGRLSVNANTLYRFRLAQSREELSRTPKYLKNYFGANMVATELSPPPEGNALWAAMVLAEARNRIHLYTRYAVYIDTDCFVSPSPVDVVLSPDMGDWKLQQGTYDIRGAKAYKVRKSGAIEDTIKLKGVAVNGRTVADLLRAKTTIERIRLPDGSTVPHVLNSTSL